MIVIRQYFADILIHSLATQKLTEEFWNIFYLSLKNCFHSCELLHKTLFFCVFFISPYVNDNVV